MTRYLASSLSLLLIFILMSSTAMAQSDKEVWTLYKQARKLTNEAKSGDDLMKAPDKFERALRIFQQTNSEKGTAYSWNQRGRINSSQGVYAKAGGTTLNEIGRHPSMILIFLITAGFAYGTATVQSKGHGRILYNEAQKLKSNAKSRDDLIRARELFERALKIFKRVNSQKEIADASGELASVNLRLGAYTKALGHYEKCLEIRRRLADLKGEGMTLNGIGSVYQSWGQYTEALEYYEESLGISRKISDVRGESVTLNNIGSVYKSLGQYAKALRYYAKSLEIARKISDVEGEAGTLTNIGSVYKYLGQHTEALEYYEESLGISREISDVRGESVTLNNIGLVYSSRGEYAKALENHEKSLGISRKISDLNGESATLNNIGLVYSYRGEYEKALENYEKSLTISRNISDVHGEGVILNNIGQVYSCRGEYGKALENYGKSLAISRNISDVHSEGVILNSIGQVYKSSGQYTKALIYYGKSLEIRRELGDVNGEGSSLSNIGVVYSFLGHYSTALEYYEKSLEIARKMADVHSEGVTLNSIASVYYSGGQYAKALENYEKSLDIAQKIDDVHGEGVTLNSIGLVYQSWGQYAKALENYEKSLELERKICDVKGEGVTLNSIGLVYQSWGQYAKALKNYEKSLEIRRKIDDVHGEGDIFGHIAHVNMAMGKHDQALADLRKTLHIYTRIKVPTDGVKDFIGQVYLEMGDMANAEPFIKEAGSNASLGRLSLLKSDFKQAQKHYEKLLKMAEENHDADGLFTAYTGLGRVYEAQEDYGKADKHYEKGMQFTEEIRSGLLLSERRDFFTVKVNGFSRCDPGKGLTRVRIKLNQASGSIDSSEITRARAFADKLSQRSVTGPSGVSPQVLEKEEELVTKLASLKKELWKTDREKTLERFNTLTSRVKTADLDLNTFKEMLWEKYRAYAAVKYPRLVPLRESAIHPDEFVVMFDVSDQGVAMWVIQGKKIVETHYKDWPLSDLQNDVKRFREPFETKKPRDFDPELAHVLYRDLMARMMMNVPNGKPIVIIPDGILAVLPFEALVTGGTATWTRGKFQEHPEGITYLGDEHPISYYQSITALTLERTMGNKIKPSDKLLVVADPVFQMSDDRAQSVPQERVAGREGEFYVHVMKAIEDDSGVKFKNLPQTGVMADRLGEMFKPNCLLLTGLKANKADFLKDVAPSLDTYGRIVFATHGEFSTGLPGFEQPFLVLTMVPPGTDGCLSMSDILSLKMNADIVALTACQTGLGREVAGEGVMSMGRAFQYAGARSVLMSLWIVEVNSALLLVETFFQNLKAGKNKLDALTAARDQVKREGYLHPSFWAPFILVGDVN